MVDQINLPGLISSLLFSGLAAYGICSPLFRGPEEHEPAEDPERKAAAAAFERCVEALVSLETEYRNGEIETEEYNFRRTALRRQALELRWKSAGDGAS